MSESGQHFASCLPGCHGRNPLDSCRNYPRVTIHPPCQFRTLPDIGSLSESRPSASRPSRAAPDAQRSQWLSAVSSAWADVQRAGRGTDSHTTEPVDLIAVFTRASGGRSRFPCHGSGNGIFQNFCSPATGRGGIAGWRSGRGTGLSGRYAESLRRRRMPVPRG
jgi:hypothetical protein